MKKLEWNLNRKQCILLGINGMLLVAFLIVTVMAHKEITPLYSQQAAERWAFKGESYAQVSAFFSPDRNVQTDEVKGMRNSLLQKLSEDSYYDREASGRVLIDAYSGECEAQIRKDGNTLSVTAVGVGNDFFQFHPIPLLSGGYISGEDLNHDRVILDENLAWAMFGSNDIVGMQLWMGDNVYVVAGVTAVDEDSLYKTAYGTGNRIYMTYETLKAQQEGLKVTCYEAVMPNPISNYAFYALKSACGQEEAEDAEALKDAEKNPLNFDSCEVIENSNRFESIKLLENLAGSKYKSMKTNSIGYPFWENIARVIVDRQICLLIIRYMLLLFPVICMVVWLYRLWKSRTFTVGGLIVAAFDGIQEKQAQHAQKKREKQEVSEKAGDEDLSEQDVDVYEGENAEDLRIADETAQFFQSEDWNDALEEEDDRIEEAEDFEEEADMEEAEDFDEEETDLEKAEDLSEEEAESELSAVTPQELFRS